MILVSHKFLFNLGTLDNVQHSIKFTITLGMKLTFSFCDYL